MADIATRVYNHNWKIDPIVRSVLDTDFYKLLMGQMIYRRHRETRVTFGIINRSSRIPLGRIIDPATLREQLDHVRTLKLSRGEATWLRGNVFGGRQRMFSPEYIRWLEEFRFPDYQLDIEGDQIRLTFEGPWVETTMWEVPALAIVSELYSREVTRQLGRFELQVLYARAMTRVWEKVERLRRLPDARFADFGTRRRHSYLWQDWCVQAMTERLGPLFLGTSNYLMAMRREVEAVGTNAHELPMVYAALARDDEALRRAPYQVLSDWQQDYDGNLLIVLPDTFGTGTFLDNAPPWVAGWTGVRIDSGDPVAGAELAIAWWRKHGHDPRQKLVIFSDALDVTEIERLYGRFHGEVRLGFGWGTNLTNDFRGFDPDGRLDALSLVCKVLSADGRPAVKLSDDPSKAVGVPEEVARYRRAFGRDPAVG